MLGSIVKLAANTAGKQRRRPKLTGAFIGGIEVMKYSDAEQRDGLEGAARATGRKKCCNTSVKPRFTFGILSIFSV